MDNTNTCPVCLKDNVIIDDSASNMLDLENNINSNVYKCNNCSSMYLWPYISSEDLSKLYESSYFTGEATSLDIPSSGNDYEEEFAMDRAKKFKSTIELLLSYKSNAKNILDIGAATGKFLSIAKEYNLDVNGVEYSGYAAQEATDRYGFNFFVGDLQDFNTNDKFDLIHLNHVFEHLTEPNLSIKKMDTLLADDGFIYIEVPFQFNIVEKIKYKLFNSRKSFDIFSVHHPIFYRPNSLKMIFEQYGFECHYIKVFDESRYPSGGIKNNIKKLIWKLLSFFNQGIMIEAIFSRKNNI
jgi:SAM-dependent methyltransferase